MYRTHVTTLSHRVDPLLAGSIFMREWLHVVTTYYGLDSNRLWKFQPLALLTLDSGSADHTHAISFTFYHPSFTLAIELTSRFPSRLIQLCTTHILGMMRCYIYKYILLEMRWVEVILQLAPTSSYLLQMHVWKAICEFLQKERCSRVKMWIW